MRYKQIEINHGDEFDREYYFTGEYTNLWIYFQTTPEGSQLIRACSIFSNSLPEIV